MGGHAAGEVASKVAVDSINEFVTLTGGDEEITWPFGLDETISYDGNRLKTAIRHANRRCSRPPGRRPSTRAWPPPWPRSSWTATSPTSATWATAASTSGAAASSRQLTSDHSWVNEQIQSGVISAEQARNHPLRNVVTRALGRQARTSASTCRSRKMAPGDDPPPLLRRPHHHGPRRGHRAHPRRGRGRRRQGRPRPSWTRPTPAAARTTSPWSSSSSRSERMLPQAADARPRYRIGRYLVTGRIGTGGMGMVYRGLDEALEREVAVKTLTAEGTLDAESRRRFEVEAKAAARCSTRTSSPSSSWARTGALPFIAMELLPGADLEALLRSGEELLARREARRRDPGLPRPRLRPRARDRPPRHQAQQHPAPRRRHRQDHGLRDRQARGHRTSPRRA